MRVTLNYVLGPTAVDGCYQVSDLLPSGLKPVTQPYQRGITFAIAVVTDDVRQEFDRFGVTERIGEDKYFASLDDAFDAFHAAK